MFPVHHQFDLHPPQMNEMQSAVPHYRPSSEAIPPQMRPVPDNSYYQSWPCSSSNYAYMHPTQFHGCCQQTPHFPGSYGFIPPYFQQSPHYFHGNCAAYPGPYPTPCISPLPYHNTMELPHYEYGKNTHHCCSCPNNSCNRNSGRNVKIEEADPHSESKVDQSSLVPVKSRNCSDPLVGYVPGNTNDLQHEKQESILHNAKSQYPYPILWFPMPEKSAKSNNPYPILWFPSACNSKDGMCNEPKAEKQIGSCPMTPDISKSQERQPNFMNGWFPFSTDKLKRGSPREEPQQHVADDKSGLACPVFWIPYKPDRKEIEESKTNDVDQECARRAPPPSLENLSEMVPANKEEVNNERKDGSSKEIVKSNKLKTIPVNQAEPNEGEKKGGCAKSSKIPVNCSDKGKSEMVTANKEEENNERKDGSSKEIVKTNKLKTIPVKQVEPNEGEKKGECARSSEIPVNCSDKRKLSKDGDKRKSPSPTKSSKLPPVCLRVDPMPRKRTSNGGSRSPSPPGEKEKSNKVSGQDTNPGAMNTKEILQPSSTQSAVEVSDKGEEQHKSKSRTIQVSEGAGNQGGKCELSNNTPDLVLANHSDKPAVDLPVTDVKCKDVVANNGGVEEDKSMHFSYQTPDHEGKSNNVSGEDLKAGASVNTEQIPQPNLPCCDLALGDNEKQQHKSKLRTIQVSEATASEASDSESFNNAPDVVPAYHTGDKPAADLSITDIKCRGIADANSQSAEEGKCCQKTENEDTLNAKENHTIRAKESIRINLTEAEAARIIQSTYRGYAVRKWEPLVKLKQVMEVKMKAGELKCSIEAFESSLDIQGFEKWKTVTGETIMSLLLKLDTIQGVLPSIREFRRSVAKELVDLQEKVDHITKKKTEIVSLQDSPGEVLDDKADICNKKGQEEEKQGQEDKEAETELVNEFKQGGGVCQAENDQESITEVTTMETKPHCDDPKLDAVSNSHGQDCHVMPMKVADVSEISLEPISNTCAETELENDIPASGEISFSHENNVSEAKDMEEFPIAEIKEDVAMADSLVVPNEQMQERASGDEVSNNLPGVPEEYNHIKDNYPLKGNQGADEVLAENYIEPKLAQLPQVVNLTDDNCESKVHFEIEEEEKKHKTDVERVDVNVEWADGGVSDANYPASRQETAMEMESSTDILNDKREASLENEIPALNTYNTTGKSEEEVEQQQLLFSESKGVDVPVGGEENSTDFINSSDGTKPQEYDYPVKLSKSCEVKQPNGKIDLQLRASSEGAEGNGIGMILTDKSNYPVEELPPTPTCSEISIFSEGDRKLMEENMKLKETMQKLIEVGQDQLAVIANLSSRMKELEKKISKKKKKLRGRRHGGLSQSWSGSSSCSKPISNEKVKNAVAMAM